MNTFTTSQMNQQSIIQKVLNIIIQLIQNHMIPVNRDTFYVHIHADIADITFIITAVILSKFITM